MSQRPIPPPATRTMDAPLFDAAFDTPRGKGSLADELLEAIRREAEDDRIVWLGPGLPRELRATSILWIGAMLYVTSCVIAAWSLDRRRPSFWPRVLMDGAFFFAVQAPMMALNVRWQRSARRRLLVGYALTDRRAIVVVIDPGRKPIAHSYRLEDLGRPRRVDARDGVGDLIFTARPRPIAKTSFLRRPSPPGFYSVPDVREAETILLRLQGNLA